MKIINKLGLLILAFFVLMGVFSGYQITQAYTGGGTATIAVDGGGNVSGVTVTKSISHIFTTILTIDTTGMTLGAASPTFTIPTGFTVPTTHAVATAGEVNTNGMWSVVSGTGSCVVDSAPTSSTTTATGQVITVDITADCAAGDTITLTYKGTSNVTMGATQLVVSTTNGGDTTTPTPLTAGSPTITVIDTANITIKSALIYSSNTIQVTFNNPGGNDITGVDSTKWHIDVNGGGVTPLNPTSATIISAGTPWTIELTFSGNPFVYPVTFYNAVNGLYVDAGGVTAGTNTNVVVPDSSSVAIRPKYLTINSATIISSKIVKVELNYTQPMLSTVDVSKWHIDVGDGGLTPLNPTSAVITHDGGPWTIELTFLDNSFSDTAKFYSAANGLYVDANGVTTVSDNSAEGDMTVHTNVVVPDSSSIAIADGQAPTLAASNIFVNNSVQPNQVILTFSEPLALGPAQTKGNYIVTNGTIIYTIATAVLSPSNTVTLTLATVDPADNKTFITNDDFRITKIRVTPSAGITDTATPANPYAGGLVTANVNGTYDGTPATVTAALTRTNATTYKVTFSEKLDLTTSQTLNNYTLGGTCLASTGNPSAAVLQATGVDVLLTIPDTSGCADSQTVIVTPLASITDVAGWPITSSGATKILVSAPTLAQPAVVPASTVKANSTLKVIGAFTVTEIGGISDTIDKFTIENKAALTAVTADIASVAIYSDSGTLGIIDGSDALACAQATTNTTTYFDADGSVITFTCSSPIAIGANATKNYLAVITTTSDATNGRTMAAKVNAHLVTASAWAVADLSTTNSITIDTTTPTLSIGAPSLSLTATGPVTYLVIYSDPDGGTDVGAINLAPGNITLVSTGTATGTISSVTGPSLGRTVHITGISGNGTLGILSIAAATASDLAGNTTLAAGASATFNVDNTVPTLTSAIFTNNDLKVGENSLVTFTFSEPITGFTNADLTIPHGGLTTVGSSDGGITWTATFTPTASIEFPTNAIIVAMTGVADIVGNAGTGTTNSSNYAIDTLAPSIPVATPVADTYSSAQIVALSSEGSTSIMYSTTDDYDPSADICSIAPKYHDPISVTSSMTIRAVGCDDAGNKSPMGTFVYTINIPPATPIANPVANTYSSAQTVTLSSEGSTSIMYSIDGSDPSLASCFTGAHYVNPIPVTSSITIRAVGCDDAGNKSPLGTFVYTINIPPSTPSTPTATPTAGTYTSAQSVTLSSDVSEFLVSTDGSDVSESICFTGVHFVNPILVTSSMTIKAVACDDAGNKSPLGTFVYTINIPSTSHSSSGSYLPGYGPKVNIIPVVSVVPVVNQIISTSPTSSSLNSIIGSGKCAPELIITDNMKNGNRNGVYSEYNKGTVKQVKILQAHINRILASAYKEAAGPIDGIYGKLTKQGVERLQKALNNFHPSDKSLIIDGIIGSYTKDAINNSCGNN